MSRRALGRGRVFAACAALSWSAVAALALAFVSRVLQPAPVVPHRPPMPCRPGYYCQLYGTVKIEIPSTLVNGGPLGWNSQDEGDETYLSFWLPDVLPPQPDDSDRDFSLYPDVERDPQPANPRRFVEMRVCGKAQSDNGCLSANDILSMDRPYMKKPHILPSRLINSKSEDIIIVDDIVPAGVFHLYYGKVGCHPDGCMGSYLIRCWAHVDHPPYRVCDGEYDVTRWGLTGHALFAVRDDQQIAKTMSSVVGLVEGWSSQTLHATEKEP